MLNKPSLGSCEVRPIQNLAPNKKTYMYRQAKYISGILEAKDVTNTLLQNLVENLYLILTSFKLKLIKIISPNFFIEFL